MNQHNLSQYYVSSLEASGKYLIVMWPLDTILVYLVMVDGCQRLFINEVQLVKSNLYPFSFVELNMGQNP